MLYEEWRSPLNASLHFITTHVYVRSFYNEIIFRCVGCAIGRKLIQKDEKMIHKYKLNGYNVVLDVNSGAIHVVDDLASEILDLIEDEHIAEEPSTNIVQRLVRRYSQDKVEETWLELYKLYKAEELFSKDHYEEMASKLGESPIKAMCLNVAHDCNLRCEYCFASKGDFGAGRELMSLEIAKAAIDFLVKFSAERHNLEVDFFGGEPLMNFDVVKSTVNYAKSLEQAYGKHFRFTITTNGLLLTDDTINFINENMDNVVLSLDGRKQVNDGLRVTAKGTGSYDAIVPKYQELVKRRKKLGKDYYVRGTFTRRNLDFTKDVLHMNRLGFDQISIEPVVADENLDYSIGEDDLDRIFKEYEILQKEIISQRKKGNYFNFFHFMLDLDQGPCAIKRLKGCGCGNEYISVTPNGDIFPCHQFVGKPDWKMGNVTENEFDESIKAYFSRANIYTKADCRNCWAKFYCSGGCNANNLQYAGDILKANKISCDLERKRLECAIALKIAEANFNLN